MENQETNFLYNQLQNQVSQLSSELNILKQQISYDLSPHSIESALKYNATEIGTLILNKERIIEVLDYLTKHKMEQIDKSIGYCFPEEFL